MPTILHQCPRQAPCNLHGVTDSSTSWNSCRSPTCQCTLANNSNRSTLKQSKVRIPHISPTETICGVKCSSVTHRTRRLPEIAMAKCHTSYHVNYPALGVLSFGICIMLVCVYYCGGQTFSYGWPATWPLLSNSHLCRQFMK